MSQQIYLYGIAGPEDMYRVVKCTQLDAEDLNVAWMKREAVLMKLSWPSIEHVYAIDQRKGLRRDYVEAFKKNSIESWHTFKSILMLEGLKIF